MNCGFSFLYVLVPDSGPFAGKLGMDLARAHPSGQYLIKTYFKLAYMRVVALFSTGGINNCPLLHH